MINASRRHLLTAFAASAVVPLTGAAAAPARAATSAPTAVTPPAASGAPASVTLAPLDASYFAAVTLGSSLSTQVLPGAPLRTEVTSGGRRVALLTHGARTVVLTGPGRTFTENKRPFVDDFRRTLPDLSRPEADRQYWGTSPGGGVWSTLGPSAADYSVVPGAGVITLTTDYASRHATLRDGEITDIDVRSTARFDKVPTGEACSYALSFGYQDTHNNYRARLSFLTTGAVQLRVEKEVADTVTQLTSALTLATGVPANTDWTIRVRREERASGSRRGARRRPNRPPGPSTSATPPSPRAGWACAPWPTGGAPTCPCASPSAASRWTRPAGTLRRPSPTATGCGYCPSRSTAPGPRNWNR